MHRLPRASAGLLAAVLWVGCGAKTGLPVPDGGADAGPPGVDASVPCFEIPIEGGPIDVPLETVAELGRADVVFLIDTTASMRDEIERIRTQLRDRLAPAIQAEIPDAMFGVATFADFPIEPFGSRDDDNPFRLMLPITDDITRVQAAMNAIELGDGRDEPESQVEALYQLATGEGIGPFVPPTSGCPMGGVGYPCFRRDALPITLMFTDAPFHNGPGGDNGYGRAISPTPHSYDEAIAELNRLRVRVIGFDSGSGRQARAHLERLARDTLTVGMGGQTLVFDIGESGERLGTGVVDAIRTFAGSVVFDIDTLLVDPVPGDGVDVRDFVEAVIALRATPMSGVAEIDRAGGVFRGVVAGTTVVFQLTIRNDAVVPGPTAQRFRLEIVFRGDGRTRLGSREIILLIPGADGVGCDGPTP